MSARSIVIGGYGLNCEEETNLAFEKSGFYSKIININDLADKPHELDSVQALCIPGGFSYGDDTGSGNAFAQKMRLTLWDHLRRFIERDTLTIGICNGCQIAANLGLVPALDDQYGERFVAVTHNLTARYQCRWVDVKVQETNTPWLAGLERMHIPVAHGEGRFLMEDKILKALQDHKQIALRYVKPTCHPEGAHATEGSPAGKMISFADARDDRKWENAMGEYPANPNGSTDDIAGITDPSGRVLALMPHPERGMFTWQRDDYPRLKDKARREAAPLPDEADGMRLFRNAAEYFETAKRKTA